jgi:hypothetical protein
MSNRIVEVLKSFNPIRRIFRIKKARNNDRFAMLAVSVSIAKQIAEKCFHSLFFYELGGSVGASITETMLSVK